MGDNVDYRQGYSTIHEEHFNKELLFSINRSYREALSSFLRTDFVDAYRSATFVIDKPVYAYKHLEKCKKLIPKIIEQLSNKYSGSKQLITWSWDSFEFAFQNGKFGCFDENNKLLIDFKYDFVDIRVKGNIEYFRAEREGNKYLVFLNGKEYQMAETMEELNDNTRAFVIRNNVLINDFSKLKDFPKIKVFIIDNCGLDKIPEEVAFLKNLEILGLYKTYINPLPEFIFDLEKLKIIDFARVYFGTLSSKIFKLSSLEELYLGDNYLETFTIETCKENLKESKLEKLKTLSLRNNELSNIPELHSYFPNLRNLDISDNESLNQIPDNIFKINKIEKLNLARTNIESVPEELSHLNNLTHLNLKDNKLSKLSNEFGSLIELEELSVSANKLTSLPTSLKELKKLKKLDLSSNKLNEYPSVLDAMPWIEKIEIKRNNYNKEKESWEKTFDEKLEESKNTLNLEINKIDNYKDLPIKIEALNYLESLCFSYCSMEEILPKLGQLKNLQKLVIQGYDMNKSFSELSQLSSLGNLKRLFIVDCKLEAVPKEFGQVKNLESLFLSGNNLRSLPDELSSLKNLRELYLTSNKFTEIPECLFSLNALNKLHLHDNPIESISKKILQMECLMDIRFQFKTTDEARSFAYMHRDIVDKFGYYGLIDILDENRNRFGNIRN